MGRAVQPVRTWLVGSTTNSLRVCVSGMFLTSFRHGLTSQAHLYDHFPQTSGCLSCLRATLPAPRLQVHHFPHINQPLQHHMPTRALSG